jgi:hypothetical protein
MLFIDMDILSHSSFGSLVVAMDSNVGDSAFDFSSEASSYASEFEDVVEQETTNGVANAEDEIIPPCEDYSRDQWVDLVVVLFNACGVPVADSVCRNSNPTDCIDANPLGEEDVGVCILNSLLSLEVPPDWRFSLRRWPLRSVLHDGVSLWDHSRRFEEMQQSLFATIRPRQGRRKYDSIRVPRKPTQRRRDHTLGDTSIRSIATKDCCAKKCCQLFFHDKIKSLRQEMWLVDFCMRFAKKLEVHRNMHFDAGGCKVVTLENIEVFHAVSKADFYRFRNYSLQGKRYRFHGNSGTKKPREATL